MLVDADNLIKVAMIFPIIDLRCWLTCLGIVCVCSLTWTIYIYILQCLRRIWKLYIKYFICTSLFSCSLHPSWFPHFSIHLFLFPFYSIRFPQPFACVISSYWRAGKSMQQITRVKPWRLYVFLVSTTTSLAQVDVDRAVCTCQAVTETTYVRYMFLGFAGQQRRLYLNH